MAKYINRPFYGSMDNLKGNYIHKYPNRRKRRAELNALPNSTKVGKRRGHDPNPPIRSMRQVLYAMFGKRKKSKQEKNAEKAMEQAVDKLNKK